MFIPRQVQRRTTVKVKRCLLPALAQPEECQERRPSKRLRLDDMPGSSTTNAEASTTVDSARCEIYYEEILCGLELLLSDYAYSEPESKKRLLELERRVDGQRGYTHLSAFLDSPVFARSSPPVTQMAIRKALEDYKSELLELSPSRNHVRRMRAPQHTEPSTNWDAQTIYVEPHLSSLALSLPKLIHHLLSHRRTPRCILPVQHVHVGRRPSYAFLVLSAPVHEIEAHCWPTDWVVLTKAEWERRDSEYQALRIRESRPLGYSIDNRNALPRHLATPSSPTWAETRPLLTKTDYPTGLLVYLTNLHPSATKTSIATLISHHVDRYSGRLHGDRKRKGTIPQDLLAHPTPSNSGLVLDTTGLSIMYTDYTPGTTTATIRLASTTDASRVVAALAARRVFHVVKDDRRSSIHGIHDKDVEDRQSDAITAELVIGEREKIYWEERIWKSKRGKKAKEKKKKGDS